MTTISARTEKGMTPELFLRVTYRLRQNDSLFRSQFHGFGEVLAIDASPGNGCQPLGGAIQIDVLTDESCIHGGIEVFHIISGVSHTCVIGDIDQSDGSFPDKRLGTGQATDVAGKNRVQSVLL